MSTVVEPTPAVIDEGDYYTDGSRLYYIIKLEDECVHVENCGTLFTARVHYDTIWTCWQKLEYKSAYDKRKKTKGVFV